MSCLNRTMQYGNHNDKNKMEDKIKFKSYYVVWKLMWELLSIMDNVCLNRTMQYGNEVEEDKRIMEIMCLNRTMQYGNDRKIVDRLCCCKV